MRTSLGLAIFKIIFFSEIMFGFLSTMAIVSESLITVKRPSQYIGLSLSRLIHNIFWRTVSNVVLDFEKTIFIGDDRSHSLSTMLRMKSWWTEVGMILMLVSARDASRSDLPTKEKHSRQFTLFKINLRIKSLS